VSKKRWILLAVSLMVVCAVVTYFLLSSRNNSAQNSETNNQTEQEKISLPDPSPDPAPPAETEQPPTYDLTTPSSITFIANKNRPLPADYVPPDLITPDVRLRLSPGAEQMQFRAVAHADLKAMFEAANTDSVQLVFGSGYRSYALQKQFYDSYVERDGQAAADRYSARPGTSEHQTGLSFDVTSPSQTCHLEICFEDTPQGKWMAKNAHNYGFVLRYPEGKEAITGYQYEPWHFRYTGPELAQEVYEQNLTLEDYFKIQ
jgi:zinc D-Ala-D-Ala carboxypeptidase